MFLFTKVSQNISYLYQSDNDHLQSQTGTNARDFIFLLFRTFIFKSDIQLQTFAYITLLIKSYTEVTLCTNIVNRMFINYKVIKFQVIPSCSVFLVIQSQYDSWVYRRNNTHTSTVLLKISKTLSPMSHEYFNNTSYVDEYIYIIINKFSLQASDYISFISNS